MNIATIGAAGSVGRMITQTIIAEKILTCHEKLILVGNPDGNSAKSLPGFAADLLDGYAEITPQVEVLFDMSCLDADLIIMAAGRTLPVESNQSLERENLAEINIPSFIHYAKMLHACNRGHEIVLCISNPNELCVSVFAHYLGRKRVMGMGAFLDSLRFRQEIARDLNVRRQAVHGFMGGEHGSALVPLWSNVHVHGYSKEKLAAEIERIRKGYQIQHIFDEMHEALKPIKTLVHTGKINEAYQKMDDYPPDIRTFLKPFITHFSGGRTVTGTARATMDFIRAITSGNDALISGQIVLDGDFYGITGTLGVPFVVGNQGVERIIQLGIDENEKELLRQSSLSINKKYHKYLHALN